MSRTNGKRYSLDELKAALQEQIQQADWELRTVARRALTNHADFDPADFAIVHCEIRSRHDTLVEVWEMIAGTDHPSNPSYDEDAEDHG